MRSLAELERQVAQLEGKRDLLLNESEQLQQELAQAEQQEQHYRAALEVLQALEKNWRDQFSQRLAHIVSWGLSTIFGVPLTVSVSTEIKRGVSSSKITIKEGDTETTILDYEGGSLVNVLSVLLRAILVVNTFPPLRRALVLDEPFSMVSQEYRPAVCQLLRHLADKLDMQFIIVSHEPELVDAADVAYFVEKKGGKAVISCIKRKNEEQP